MEAPDTISDMHILEHTLAALTKLSYSLKLHIPADSTATAQPAKFITVDNFASAQKNDR